MGTLSVSEKGQISNNTAAINLLRGDLKIVVFAVRVLCEKSGVTDSKLLDALNKISEPAK